MFSVSVLAPALEERVTVVSIHIDKLDDGAIHALRQPLDDEVAKRTHETVHLDLGQVSYLSSTAVGAVVSLYRRFKADGGNLVLTNVSTFPFEVLQVTGITGLLEVRPNAERPA